MQARRSNRDRTDATTAALTAAGRRLFVTQGYAGTGTPELVETAGMTRGALYHHFADKKDLFRAVVIAENRAVAEAIERAAPGGSDAVADLLAGGAAYLDAMREPGRARLLLVEAPVVLGRDEVDAIDAHHGGRTLREGLQAGMEAGLLAKAPIDLVGAILGAAFDRAALAVAGGASPDDCLAVIGAMIEGLRARP